MELKAEAISFRYQKDGAWVLNQLSLSVKSGERLGIMAPSGFGKTTLCQILAGYEKPESGQVLLDGVPVSKIRGYCPVQMIWQHPELAVNPRRKLRETMKEGGFPGQELLAGLGIEPDWLNRYPAELSGGELQRFCIARALGEQTRFLLADEITAMMDLITRSQIWNFLLDEAERRQLGMLVVSHSESLLQTVCTRILDLDAWRGGNGSEAG